MLSKDYYKELVLPILLKNTEWSEFIDSILDEIVTLQMYNMGSCNVWGMSGVEEDISFLDSNKWELCSLYDAARGFYVQGGSFSISSEELIFTEDGSENSYAICPYSFVLDRYYTVKFKVSSIVATGGDSILRIGIGSQEETITIDLSTINDTLYEFTFLADDYYLYFGVEVSENIASFNISEINVVGVLDEDDEKERILTAKKILSVDNASSEILSLMRDSLAFPKIGGMPDALLRRIITDYDTFISYIGSEMSSIMMFYFMGYAVDFVSLYAHKDDYEAKQYSYLSEKESDILTSVGVVDGDQYATYRIKLNLGHQILVGDLISNATTPFSAGRVEVLEVSGEYLTLVSNVSVFDDDVIDAFRKYTYSVNPDESNYFKTSHIDVFFNERYASGETIAFSKLEEFFTEYLPVNVVIRFFGQATEIPDEEFSIIESLVQARTIRNETINISEETNLPEDDYIFLVSNPTPVTHVDAWGNNVDGYSFLASHIDPGSGEIIFMVIPNYL